MQPLYCLLTTAVIACLTGCSMHPQAAKESPSVARPVDTTLLVSLADGTIVKQTIDVDADICFKLNSSTSTICLTQGEAIVDPLSNAVIGYNMVRAEIDLVAKCH